MRKALQGHRSAFPQVKPTSELCRTNMAPNTSAVTIKAFSIGVKHISIPCSSEHRGVGKHGEDGTHG